MIKVWIKGVEDASALHPLAHNGVRLAVAALGSKPLSVDEAKALARKASEGGDVLLADLLENEAGRIVHAQSVIERYGLQLVAERDGEPVEVETDPEPNEDSAEVEPVEPAYPDADGDPSYIASLISLSVLGVVNGDVAQAVRFANTVRYAYKTQGTKEGLETWNDVLRILFDAFPPREQPGNSIEELATEVDR